MAGMNIEPDAALEEQNTSTDKLEEVYQRAIRRFDDAVLPQTEVRALALEARRFASIPGAQWEGEWGEMFENSIRMEINKVATGLEKICRDYRDNRIVPDFRPAGGDSNHETADTLDGMHRADSYHFKSQQARDNAFEEAAAGGFGAYRLTNEWADPYDKESDEQRINPGLIIVDADQRVYFDPNSKLYDKSDARFAFVLTALTPDAYADVYGEKPPASWPEGIERLSHFEWYAPEATIIAEYYELEERDEKLLIFEHPLSGEEQRHWSSEIDAEAVKDLNDSGFKQRSRQQKRCRVHKYTMSGQGVLKDHGFLAGTCIPIVPVYGKRWFIDGIERFSGYVQLKKDAQRLYNAKVSKLSEHDALAPREIPIFAREQMPPAIAATWARQNVDRHPYALVEPLYGPDGAIVSVGPIGKIEPPQLPPVTGALLQVAANDLVEGMSDADEVRANTSTEAMEFAATRIDAKSAIYLDNMRQSVQREGEIYLSMAGDIYYEPGRKVETMTEEGADGEAKLHEEVYGKDGVFQIRNDFTRGRYKVIADVTEATATRRDKTVRALNNIGMTLAAIDPDTAKAAISVAILNMDGEGITEFQKSVRKKLVASGVMEPNDEEKAQMEQAAESQQPDPAAQALQAQAKEFEASAELKLKQGGKAEADTKLSEAKTIETLARARQAGQPQSAPMPRPRIRMGRELAA